MKGKRVFYSWVDKAKWYFDRTFSEKSTSQLAWLVGIITVVFLLIWAFSYPFSEKIFEESNPSMSRPIRIISLLINPGAVSEVNPTMRLFAIVVAVIGIIVLSGFLITVLSNILERHIEHYRNGDIHYKLNNHTIIIGFNEHAISLIKQLLKEKDIEDKILLVSSARSSVIRERMEAEFSRNIWKQIVYYSEDVSSYESMTLLDSDKANDIYIIGDNENDNLNVKCLEYLLELNEKRNASVIPCYLFINSNATNFIIKQRGLTKEWGKILRVIPVNIAENWAKKVLIFGDNPIKLIGNKGHNRLIIVGMTEWGNAMAEVFARISHFSVGELKDPMEQFYYPYSKYIGHTTITIIDKEAESLMEKFCVQHSEFFDVQNRKYIDATQSDIEIKKIGTGNNFLDVSFEFIKGDIYCPNVRNYLCDVSKDDTHIAICGIDDNTNIEIAIHLPDAIYEEECPIYVRQQYDNIIKNLISSEYDSDNKYSSPKYDKYINVHPFGMLNNKEILFDDDDNYVQFILSVYLNQHNRGFYNDKIFLAINRYIENLYHGYYIYLLWKQIVQSGLFEDLDNILERDLKIYTETEHLRWCVNKLLSGISSTHQKDKTYFANEFIVSFEALSEEYKPFSEVNALYLKKIRDMEFGISNNS